mgnify:CR=1 FL=1
MFFIPPTDYGVLERHTQVDSILGALDIEKKSFQISQLFAWIFFPIWIMLAIVQAICFLLSNGRFHPLSKLLERCDSSSEGNYAYIRIVISNSNASFLTFSADIEDIKKVMNCPMKDTTILIKFWPQNHNMETE